MDIKPTHLWVYNNAVMLVRAGGRRCMPGLQKGSSLCTPAFYVLQVGGEPAQLEKPPLNVVYHVRDLVHHLLGGDNKVVTIVLCQAQRKMDKI